MLMKICRRMSGVNDVLKTSLYDFHIQNKGKMVEFTNYMMPIQYEEGIIEEHEHCRKKCAMFDVSHMGQLKIYGKDRYRLLNKIQTGDIEKLGYNKSQLSLMLTEEAGIIDDTIVTHCSDYIGMVVNSGNKFNDIVHMNQVKRQNNMEVDIIHRTDLSLIAIQGPGSQQVLEETVKRELGSVKFMEVIQSKWGEWDVQLSRSGYTGEDGFEVAIDNKYAPLLANHFLSHPLVKLSGLGARDTLRLEAGLCLHGHEIDLHINPVMSQLMWTVRKNYLAQVDTDAAFIGANALQIITNNKLTTHKRVGLIVLDKGIIRQDCELYDHTKTKSLGIVTTGTMSPTLKKSIAMGYLDQNYSKQGTKLFAKVRSRFLEVEVTKLPFVQTQYYK